jgi:hypothetical protein
MSHLVNIAKSFGEIGLVLQQEYIRRNIMFLDIIYRTVFI